jgi:hypothetical protein
MPPIILTITLITLSITILIKMPLIITTIKKMTTISIRKLSERTPNIVLFSVIRLIKMTFSTKIHRIFTNVAISVMTFSVTIPSTILSAIPLSIMTISITTISITTMNIMTQHNDTQHFVNHPNNIKHNNT